MRFPLLISALLCAGASVEAGEFRGRVKDEAGQPVANVRVHAAENTVAEIRYASPQSVFAVSPSETDAGFTADGKLTGEAITDAEGRFALTGLRAARYTLFAVGAERGFAMRLDATPGEPLELALRAPASLKVRVQGLKFDRTKHVLQLKPRAPLANIVLTPAVDCVGDSEFRIGSLPEVPGWNLVLTEWVVERGYSGVVALEPIDVRASATLDAVIDLDRGRGLRGSVQTAGGEALATVSIVARSKSAPARERGAISAKDGTFQLRGLADGEWTIEARRFTTRETAGCGVGPKDVFAARTFVIGEELPDVLNLEVPRLLNALRVGDVAPEFSVRALDGREITSASLRGKVVLVDFWATWCGMCRAEFPKLRETYAMFGGGASFEIVGVSIDEDIEAVRKLTETLELAWPQTALGTVERNALAQLFNIAATPSSFLIDREGKIVAINSLGLDLRAELSKLLPPK